MKLGTSTFALAAIAIAILLTLQYLKERDNTMSAKDSATPNALSAQAIAEALGLEGHIEGGYFRRTYQADHRPMLDIDSEDRFLMTSIYYMLTAESPIGHWHLNKSDIMHYYHLGDAIEYSLIYPDGRLEQLVLGSDVLAGEKLQLMVQGGIWKSSRLMEGNAGYGLISEAVSPGFDYADMRIAEADELSAEFPQHSNIIKAYSKK